MNLHTDQIHHQDRVYTRPYVLSHNNRVHIRPYVMSHNNRVHTRPYVMSHNNRVYTQPYVMSHLRCWHVPTIMNYELRIMNYPTSTTVIPAPPKSTCSSRNVLTCGTVFRYSRITCRSTPVPVPCRIRTVPASSIIASSI